MYNLVVSIILLGVTSALLALPEDSKAPLFVRADSADLNQSQHRGSYHGHIALDQGTTHIRAATAYTEGNDRNQLVKALIEGNKTAQAHYWTVMSADKPPMHAYADKMYYYPLNDRIELVGHARVTQGQHQVTAAIIHYNIKTQHVISLPSSEEQTVITVHPEQANTLESPT